MKKAGDILRATRSSSFFFSDRKLGSFMEDASQRYSYEPFLRWNPLVEQYFCKAFGPRNFARISKALTRPSCYSCIRVNSLKSSTDAVIEKLLVILKEKEAEYGNDFNEDSDMGTGNCSFSTESKEPRNLDVCCTAASGAVEDVINMFNGSFGSGPISKCLFPGLDYVLFVKGSGPHTIDYGFADGKPPKEVIVSRKCAEAVLRGAQVYVPGVMACSAHVERGNLVAVSVAVEQPSVDGGWAKGITRGTIMQGLSTDPYYSERRGLYIGQGKTMLSRSGIFRVSEGVAVDMCNRVFKLPSLHDVLDGEIFLQNLPSIVAAHALDPKKGERILDMCAAPGGKTTAIAILMRDEGEIIAADRSHNKVLGIQKLAAEMGLSCITTYKLDALKAVRRRSEGDDTTNLACSKDNYDVTVQSSDSVKLHVEKKAPITLEGLNADETLKKNAMKKRMRELTLAKLTSGRICQECGMGLEEISAQVVGSRILKAFLPTALIVSFLMLPVLP